MPFLPNYAAASPCGVTAGPSGGVRRNRTDPYGSSRSYFYSRALTANNAADYVK